MATPHFSPLQPEGRETQLLVRPQSVSRKLSLIEKTRGRRRRRRKRDITDGTMARRLMADDRYQTRLHLLASRRWMNQTMLLSGVNSLRSLLSNWGRKKVDVPSNKHVSQKKYLLESFKTIWYDPSFQISTPLKSTEQKCKFQGIPFCITVRVFSHIYPANSLLRGMMGTFLLWSTHFSHKRIFQVKLQVKLVNGDWKGASSMNAEILRLHFFNRKSPRICSFLYETMHIQM